MGLRVGLRVGATAGFLGLAACPQPTAIWLLSGAAPGQPVLGLGEQRDGSTLAELPYVVIAPCAEAPGGAAPVVWELRRIVPDAAPPRQVQVGHAPPGYRIVRGADRLAPGCYVARIQGTGRVEFEVRGDRSSVERAES